LVTDVDKSEGIDVAKIVVKTLGIFVVQEISLHIGIVVRLCIVVKVDRDRAFKNIVIIPPIQMNTGGYVSKNVVFVLLHFTSSFILRLRNSLALSSLYALKNSSADW
jgi:hypothetical protein